jgi:hypothetical protein
VKETKRQGRIAHHHADATVPHIVALLGFSFHTAKIGVFFCNFQILEQRNQEKVHFFYVESLVNSPIVSDFLASF